MVAFDLRRFSAFGNPFRRKFGLPPESPPCAPAAQRACGVCAARRWPGAGRAAARGSLGSVVMRIPNSRGHGNACSLHGVNFVWRRFDFHSGQLPLRPQRPRRERAAPHSPQTPSSRARAVADDRRDIQVRPERELTRSALGGDSTLRCPGPGPGRPATAAGTLRARSMRPRRPARTQRGRGGH